jgi:hypothetical protein
MLRLRSIDRSFVRPASLVHTFVVVFRHQFEGVLGYADRMPEVVAWFPFAGVSTMRPSFGDAERDLE